MAYMSVQNPDGSSDSWNNGLVLYLAVSVLHFEVCQTVSVRICHLESGRYFSVVV